MLRTTCTSRRRGDRSTARGFSLIELMIVVAMVGILSALAMSSISEATQEHKARAEFPKLRDALVQSRNLARATRRCVQLQVFPSEQKLVATPYRVCAPEATPPTLSDPMADRKLEFELGDGVVLSTFNTTSGALVFNDQGGTTEDVPSTLEMTSGGTHRKFTVLPGIGSVREVR